MAEAAGRFVRRFRVGWSDVDGNGHMANTAFLDRAADTRFEFFAEHGFSAGRFIAEHVGPVIVRDEILYRKELRLLEEFTVDLEVLGLSSDGTRFELGNTFHDLAGELVASVASEGTWFDLDRRRPRAPPVDLDAVQRKMHRNERFKELSPRRS